MDYKEIVKKLNLKFSEDSWWYFELNQFYNKAGEATTIDLIYNGNDNKYRVYHSILDDWIKTNKELEENIIAQVKEYKSEFNSVFDILSK